MPAATRLDPVDARRLELAQDSTTPHALGCAAIRELREETGLHLGELRDGALLPDLGALTFFFRALTPQDRPIRFDARFFLADAARLRGTWNDFSQRDVELDDLAWLTVDAARQYDLPLVTDMVLAEVAAFLDCGHRRKDVPFFHMGSDIAGTTGFSRLV